MQDEPMSIFEKSPALRWAVPAVTAVALVGGVSAFGVLHASAGDGLPSRSAAQLLVDVQQARLDGLPPTERSALQQASVVGMVFWVLSGLWMWWEIKPARLPGAVFAVVGCGVFGLLLVTL